MHNFILKLSHKIDNSSRYQKTKSFFRSILEDVNYPYKKYFDTFMIFLIVISIVILIISKTTKIPEWLMTFDLYFVTAIFAIEYLLRLWISHDIHKYIVSKSHQNPAKKSEHYWVPLRVKLSYIISLPAIIDLIAIFPKFRIIRLFKLYHYMHGTSSLFQALVKKRFEFVFLGYMLFGITFVFGSIFYLLEYGINKELHSYLDAIYWALVTISTVGYGDISPVTDMGKVVSMFGIVFGIAMISFVTSVMVSAFSERFDELRNQDSIHRVHKMANVIIINGYGHLGVTIAKKLRNHKQYEPVIIENNELKANMAMEAGYQVIRAEGSSAKLIKELYKTNNILAMLTLASSDIENIYFILNAKSIHKQSVVFARMNKPYLRAQYEAARVDNILEPYNVVGAKALRYLRRYSKKIIFFGYTHKSIHLCRVLQDESLDVSIYEQNKEQYEMAKNDGFEQVVLIDYAQENYLEQIKFLEEAVVVCAMNDEAINVYHIISLRAKGFENRIVALSDSKEDNRKLLLAGANKVFDMYEESAIEFIDMIETHIQGDTV